MKNTFYIKYKKKIYYLNKTKLKFALCEIFGSEINMENVYVIQKIFKKYSLYNKEFLNALKIT